MAEYPFKCPNCKETFTILNYSIGMSDILELRCSNCATTLHIGLYDHMIDVLYKQYGLYTGNFFANLYNSLKPCKCGGHYSTNAAYRCRACNATVTLDEIKKQIDYKGTRPAATPGIAMDNIVDSSKENIWKDSKDIIPLRKWWKFW
jgi:predicted Zn finger-like uncharacterized protein